MPAELPAGVDKIRVICKQRRIRLEEFFATFDRLRTKKCSAAQFERALDIAGVKRVLSKKDNDADQTIAELAAFYTLPEDPLMVDYLRFCDTVNEASEPSPHNAWRARGPLSRRVCAACAGLHHERPREGPDEARRARPVGVAARLGAPRLAQSAAAERRVRRAPEPARRDTSQH